MTSRPVAVNPFASMLDPSAVLAACARSERLNSLARRVHCRMDEPSRKVSPVVAEYDAAIEAGKPGYLALLATESPAQRAQHAAKPVVQQQLEDIVVPGVRWG